MIGHGPLGAPTSPSAHTRAAVRGLEAPDEVRGPLWVGFGDGLADVECADEGMWVVVG